MSGGASKMEKSNRINPEVKELLTKNKIMIMRDKRTKTPLNVSFTEEGLRLTANKNGVYLYCEGRVTNYNDAKIAKKNPNVIVERFIPRESDNPTVIKQEILWANKAKYLLGIK
jgi:hypothetical protein